MARIGSAHPRERSAFARGPLTGLGTWLRQFEVTEGLASDRWLQAAAGLHLASIAAAVIGPSSPPLPIFLTVTGLALVVLAFTRTQHATAAQIADITPAASQAFELERQSQRLVEIADAASRARREAEMRGQLWAELTARMSHELRTPLNAVIGFSDLMGAEMFGPLGHDRYRDYTRHIRECSRSLLKCTEDTLALTSTLAKSDAADMARTLDLVCMLREAAEFHSAEIAKYGLKVILPCEAPVEVTGEIRPIRQILINLIAEAVARTRRAGTIVVKLTEDSGSIALSVTVAKAQPRPDEGQSSLAVCIARVLLEQQGSALVESDDHETWRVTTFFHRPSQADFFASA
jgi:signal transduction histidine kinase